jgi:SOS response associated peptidase (SRAP)
LVRPGREDRPLFAFAGLWASWRGVRGPKSAPVEGRHELFGFLTTDANAIVAPIHPKAMPIILTTAAEVDQWLEADTADTLALRRPLPDDALPIVAKGEKEDRSPEFPRAPKPDVDSRDHGAASSLPVPSGPVRSGGVAGCGPLAALRAAVAGPCAQSPRSSRFN